MKNFGILASSVNPEKLADTVEGILKVIAGVALYFGFTSISGDLNTVIQQIGIVVTAGYAFYGAVQTLFGLCRKIIVAVQQAYSTLKPTTSV